MSLQHPVTDQNPLREQDLTDVAELEIRRFEVAAWVQESGRWG